MTEATPDTSRRPYRPPVGIPLPQQNRIGGVLVSVLVHLGLLLLVLGPFWVKLVIDTKDAGMGPGAAGGGGGGSRGTGGVVTERLQYVQVAPQTQPQVVAPKVIPPPVVKPPEVKPPDPVVPPKPEPAKTTTESPKDAAPVAGTGGGSGRDGTAGSGPGTGGGSGSGTGTGKGSGVGAGTGGGEGKIYPPSVTTLAILPLPVPSKIRPYKLVAVFEVDEKGKAKLLRWNESRDSDYNRKIKQMLDEVRFKPAVRPDGTTVRDTAFVTAEVPGLS